MSINLLDFLFLVILAFLSVRGVLRGFVAEVLSKAALILGFAAAVILSADLFRMLSRFLGDSVCIQIVSFLLVFDAVFLLVKLLETFLQKGMERLNLRQLDRFLGFLVGALEGFLLIAVILFLLQIQPFFDLKEMLPESLFGRFFLPFLEQESLGIAGGSSI